MTKKNTGSSALSKISLKSRLLIAFAFATFFPASIVFVYITNVFDITIPVITVIVLVTLLGWWFVFDVFKSIERIYDKSKSTAMVASDQKPGVFVQDEVERLDVIFNALSTKVRESVEELREVSRKTEELNKAITQKVNVFSAILQANILFSKGAGADEIFRFLAERLKNIMQSSVIVVLRKEGAPGYNIFSSGVASNTAQDIVSHQSFAALVRVREPQVLDKKHKTDIIMFVRDCMGCRNILVNPIFMREENLGCIISAVQEEQFIFSSDDYQIVELFSRNMSIVWEHTVLAKRIEDLEMIDPLTGVYNEKFFLNRLEEEIKRASVYQRPCGLLLLEIGNYSEYQQALGMIELERLFKRIVGIFRDTIRPIDILGRVHENKIGAILIERSKRQSQFIGQQLTQSLQGILKDTRIEPRIVCAVAENPLDGKTAAQVLERAHDVLSCG